MVIEPNDSINVNTIIESRDGIFEENRFNSIPRPRETIAKSSNVQIELSKDKLKNDDLDRNLDVMQSKRIKRAKAYGPDLLKEQ